MIRMLEDLTGIDAKKIPLDDPAVMSLFSSTEALGIKPEDFGGVPLGSLGIPEFGTEFAMQMLIDTKPTHFSDLVRIAGLGARDRRVARQRADADPGGKSNDFDRNLYA